MTSPAPDKAAELRMRCAYQELSYDLGEMPDIDAALAPMGAIGFLESREGTEKWARYGVAAARPILKVHGKEGRYRLHDRHGNATEGTFSDPLDLMRSLSPSGYVPAGLSSFRYVGGWLGSLGYETSRQFEGIRPAPQDDLDLPDFAFFLPSLIVLKDAVQRRLVLVAWALEDEDPNDLLREAALRLQGVEGYRGPALGSVVRTARSSFPREDFLRAVGQARRLITDGELIQVVLSRRWEVTPPPEPEAVYDALSRLNPSPYHFFLRLPGGVLLGASPELLVRREIDTLTVRPIAGTRRRGKNEEEDRINAEDMLADPKERAEHIMLVDLGRNDLGSVAAPGSVEVTRRMDVEYYSHVMHMTSEVRSYIASGKDSFDVLRNCFPAGTVSGAPKVRAMQIIAGMEPVVRGPYAGGVGYFDVRGNMDFCITIRSVFYAHGRAYVQAGAGIVYDSVPEREYDEIAAKAQAMFRAFGNVEGKDRA
ncbi:MAG: anthranilate synthase component I family protein [bacterium]|nr:MAG: anthranilate synthase component I family protein [bacterium]